MANDIFNAELDEIIPKGASGNQAYFGIFYENRLGRFPRLTQAEGNEVANNVETKEVNTIGMTGAKTVVKSFSESFSKDIVIEKGDENYEFFNDYNEGKYTGKNAEIRMIMVDFMHGVPAATVGKQRYRAYSYNCTVSVDTVNNTDGKLAVSFKQAGNRVSGVAECGEEKNTAVFTPSSKIPISEIKLSDVEVEVEVGGEKLVSVDFEPFGAPDSFTQTSSDTSVCTAEARRQSVVITGKKTGKATVTVKNGATENITKEIKVTVGTPSEPSGLLDD
jgi:hypothetical protein